MDVADIPCSYSHVRQVIVEVQYFLSRPLLPACVTLIERCRRSHTSLIFSLSLPPSLPLWVWVYGARARVCVCVCVCVCACTCLRVSSSLCRHCLVVFEFATSCMALLLYLVLFVCLFLFNLFCFPCNRPCAPKEKWHIKHTHTHYYHYYYYYYYDYYYMFCFRTCIAMIRNFVEMGGGGGSMLLN